MSEEQFFLIIDTETAGQTDQTVADFGAVLVDADTGFIKNQIGVFVYEEYIGGRDLFYRKDVPPEHFWSKRRAKLRKIEAEEMVKTGQRWIGAIAKINEWLTEINAKYSPIFTAYNWPFDRTVCRRSGINIDIAKNIDSNSWCLLQRSRKTFLSDIEYLDWAAEKGFTTETGRIQCTANSVAQFLFRDEDYPPEPHTSLEDARDYEAPILLELRRRGAI